MPASHPAKVLCHLTSYTLFYSIAEVVGLHTAILIKVWSVYSYPYLYFRAHLWQVCLMVALKIPFQGSQVLSFLLVCISKAIPGILEILVPRQWSSDFLTLPISSCIYVCLSEAEIFRMILWGALQYLLFLSFLLNSDYDPLYWVLGHNPSVVEIQSSMEKLQGCSPVCSPWLRLRSLGDALAA